MPPEIELKELNTEELSILAVLQKDRNICFEVSEDFGWETI